MTTAAPRRCSCPCACFMLLNPKTAGDRTRCIGCAHGGHKLPVRLATYRLRQMIKDAELMPMVEVDA